MLVLELLELELVELVLELVELVDVELVDELELELDVLDVLVLVSWALFHAEPV